MGERHPWEGHTFSKEEFCAPFCWRWSIKGLWFDWSRGFTVYGQPTCPEAPHPNCGAVGTCIGSCLMGGH